MRMWQVLEFYPPYVVRLLARLPGPHGVHHPVPLSDAQIAERSGLPPFRINQMSHEASWDRFTVDEVKRFTLGCNIDFANPTQMKRLNAYLTGKKKFTYLRKSPVWPEVKSILSVWKSLTTKSPTG